MSSPAPSLDTPKRRTTQIQFLPDAQLAVVRQLLKHGLLDVGANFELLNFCGDVAPPLPEFGGGCRFQVPVEASLPVLTATLREQDFENSVACADFVGFCFPRGVEIVAAAHLFDDADPASICAGKLHVVPFAPSQLELPLEPGRTYFLSVDAKYSLPSTSDEPLQDDSSSNAIGHSIGYSELPIVGISTSHAFPFTSSPGEPAGWSQHDSDKSDQWGTIPYWWSADQNVSQWLRPCLLLPPLQLLHSSTSVDSDAIVETTSSFTKECDVTFSFSDPETQYLSSQFHIVHMRFQVIIIRANMDGTFTNISPDYESRIKAKFSPYNISPDTYEDGAAVYFNLSLEGSSYHASYCGNSCCRNVRVRMSMPTQSGPDEVYVLLRDIKIFGDALWKEADHIGSAFDRTFSICRDDACIGFRSSMDRTFSWTTYGDIFNRVVSISRVFNFFQNDCITILAPCVNCVDVIAAQLACYTTGNTFIPLGSCIPTSVLNHVLHETRPKIVLFDFAFAYRISNLVSNGDYVLPPFVELWLYCFPENTDSTVDMRATIISKPFQPLGDCQPFFQDKHQCSRGFLEDIATRSCLIYYTSGSTGLPKGVPRAFQDMKAYMNAYVDAVGSVHLAAMPLSHMSEGASCFTSLLHGNRVALPTLRLSDSSGLTIIDQFSDLATLEPTFISSVPRVFEIVQRMFCDDIALHISQGLEPSLARSKVISEYRSGKVFGKRLRGMFIGSAPITSQLDSFLREVWGPPNGPLTLTQGYGSSECGTIAAGQLVVPNTVVILVENVSSGYGIDSYRGEVLVHTSLLVDQYLHAKENHAFVDNVNLIAQGPFFQESWAQTLAASPMIAQSKNLSTARFFCTGDMAETSPELQPSEVERAINRHQSPSRISPIVLLDSSWGMYAGNKAILVPPGCKLNVIGRLKNVVKLPNGEFVAPEFVENCLSSSQSIDQVCVIARSTHAFTVAVIVPKNLELASTQDSQMIIGQEISKLAHKNAIQSYMVPRQIFIASERWSSKNGMMTYNEKLNRAGIMQYYASEIDKLFLKGSQNLADCEATVVEKDLTLDSLLGIIQSVTKSQISVVGTTDISSPEVLGGDSLTITLLISKLNSVYQLNLSPSIMFSLKTVGDLFHFIVKRREGSKYISPYSTSSLLLQDLFDRPLSEFLNEAAVGHNSKMIDSAISITEKILEPHSASIADQISERSNVFLTGVTGFLGCHILLDLLINSNANVHCLIRSHSESESLPDRLLYCLSKFKISLTTDQLQRVIFYDGDLSKPLFGLPDETFQHLSDSIDTIIHNGAHVNWLMTYEQLRRANVLGTSTAILLALIGKCKSFVYVSTISVVESSRTEMEPLNTHLCLSPGRGGYMQTKFVSERIARAASTLGLHTTIVRPGTIVGHTKTGASNASDYAASIISAFARMREFVASDGCFDLSPVDLVARATVLLSFMPVESHLRVFHLVDAGKARVKEVGEAASGVDGVGLSFAEFKASVERRLGSGACDNGAQSLQPFTSFMEDESLFQIHNIHNCDSTIAVLKQLGLEWRCDAAACVRKIVAFCLNLDPPKKL